MSPFILNHIQNIMNNIVDSAIAKIIVSLCIFLWIQRKRKAQKKPDTATLDMSARLNIAPLTLDFGELEAS